MRKIIILGALAVLAAAALCIPPMRAHAGPNARGASTVENQPFGPYSCTSVSLSGSAESVFTGSAGKCYSIATNGADVYAYWDQLGTGTAASTTTAQRLADPGIRVGCLFPSATKIHLFASSATTASVCQVSP